jgi:energy-coupling factor transport system ATP-binding protein
VKKTVREDLLELLPIKDPQREQKAARVTALCRLEVLLDRHPYDLSGGVQQRRLWRGPAACPTSC